MKLLPTLALSTLLALSAIAFAPTAAADTCEVSDPDIERIVCTPVEAAQCAAFGVAYAPKQAVATLVHCATVLY